MPRKLPPFESLHVVRVSGCWEWTGPRNEDGYGKYGKYALAHRLAYINARGTIPSERVVMHTCDNPPCVNPAHLKLGTVAENNADRAQKGRSKGVFRKADPKHPAKVRRGEKHSRSTLSADDVRAIRKRHAAGESQTSLATLYRVNSGTVSRIVRNEWRTEVV
jgi:hypothetical protein